MLMKDSNKDEAIRCVDIAHAAFVSGNNQRALKFIRLARRLDPNIPVEGLLAACEKVGDAGPSSMTGEILEEQVPGDLLSSKSSKNFDSDHNYTEEHIRLVREISRSKDYYAILGVEKSCSGVEIRRAYKKLFLKIHPDKNKVPGAEEAFKTVCKAFKCLSDEQSRRLYDQTGLVDDSDTNHFHDGMRRRRRRAAKNHVFDEDFDPDEIFRSFFGYQGDMFRHVMFIGQGVLLGSRGIIMLMLKGLVSLAYFRSCPSWLFFYLPTCLSLSQSIH